MTALDSQARDDPWTADCGLRCVRRDRCFLSHFKDLEDPRQQGKVDYPLEEIVLLCLLAVLAGADTSTNITLFAVRIWTCRVASGRS
jgi:hypothetical protein